MNEALYDICLPIGVVLKDIYEIRSKISVSELSIVYLAYDLKREKKCIVKEYFPNKLVLRDLDKKTVLCRMPSFKGKYYHTIEVFMNEAIILKDLNHKNIARLYDYFMDNNTGYIVMDYYEGKTLDLYMKEETKVSILNFIKKIFIPLTDAVHKMHNKKILHRDLKPTNIIIDKNGYPVLIDFGSAVYYKKAEDKKIFVTPGFSPIEFYSEKSTQGKYSDVYSLCATLYYYLTGKAPVEASQRVIEDDITDIRKYNREISFFFSRIIMKNLSLDYKKRFFSVRLLKLFSLIEYFFLKIKYVFGC